MHTLLTFVPVKIAHKAFESVSGADENLTPLIFLHGITSTKEDWKDIPKIISDKTKRKAYAFDARNHGDSEFTEKCNFDLNVDDLFHFMNTLSIPKAILIGHSMGGITSIKAALVKPERVEMVFVEDMYVKRCPNEAFDTVASLLKLWVEGLENVPKDLPPSEVLTFVVDYFLSKLPPESPYSLDKDSLYKSNIKFIQKPDGSYDVKFNKEVIFRILQNPHSSMSDPIGKYHGPAYFVYGGQSFFCVGKEEENIKNHFPNAELIEIKDATHSVHAEFQDEFVNIIISRLL